MGRILRVGGDRPLLKPWPAFVLVHGTTQSPAGWDRLAGALGTRGYDVTAIDLPVNRPEWTVAGHARDGHAGR